MSGALHAFHKQTLSNSTSSHRSDMHVCACPAELALRQTNRVLPASRVVGDQRARKPCGFLRPPHAHSALDERLSSRQRRNVQPGYSATLSQGSMGSKSSISSHRHCSQALSKMMLPQQAREWHL